MNADRAQSPAMGRADDFLPRRMASVLPHQVGPESHHSGEVGTELLDPVPNREQPDGGTWAPEPRVRREGVGGSWRAAGSPDPSPSSSTERWHFGVRVRWWARWRLPVVYATAVILLGVGLAMAVGSHDRLRTTDDRVRADRALLAKTILRAHRAGAELEAVSGQAAVAGRMLAAETSELAATEAQLASTEANVFANGVSINDLDTCLSGVEQALNLISLGDQQSAAGTLDAVAASCRAAEPGG